MKQPYIALYTGDWLKDTKLSLCSPATRGVWIDLICGLHELGHGGVITANAQQIARICRCSVADVDSALSELRTYDAAEVYEREGRYTIICRRMKRVAELSEKRQQAGSKRHSKTEAKPDNDNEDEVLREIEEFCTEIGLERTDGEACFRKWQGNGWTNGGKPIKDWKATIRSWKLYGYLPSQKKTQQDSTGIPPRRMSAFEIEKRQKAITERINQLYQDQPIVDSKRTIPPEVQAEMNHLKKERDKLQRELASS